MDHFTSWLQPYKPQSGCWRTGVSESPVSGPSTTRFFALESPRFSRAHLVNWHHGHKSLYWHCNPGRTFITENSAAHISTLSSKMVAVTFFPTYVWFKWYFTPFRFIQFYKLWILQSGSWGFGVKLQWTHFLGTTGQWLTMVKRSVQMALLFTVKTGLALKLVANKPTRVQLRQNKINIKAR